MGLEVAGVWVEQEKQSEGSEGWTREVGSRGRCGWKGEVWLEGGWGTGFWIERILSIGRVVRGGYCGGEVGGQ